MVTSAERIVQKLYPTTTIIPEEDFVESTAKSDDRRSLKPFNCWLVRRTVSFYPGYIFELLKSAEKRTRRRGNPIVTIISETFFIEGQSQ